MNARLQMGIEKRTLDTFYDALIKDAIAELGELSG